MPLDEATLGRLLTAARSALRSQGVQAVEPGDPFSGGSGRSHVVRAVADRGREPPLRIIIKMPVDQVRGLARERAGLTLVRDHQLPASVQLLGITRNPIAVILEDLGDGPSVADCLLGESQPAAEQAIIDWARALGALHAASAGLEDEFAAELQRFAIGREDINPCRSLLARTAERLPAALAPYDISPPPSVLRELRTLSAAAEPLHSPARKGLVPGDSCPDNALYADGQLTLIDFESAAYRPAAWDAAYVTVPWPTCWCSWALPAELSRRAITAWRDAAASSDQPSDDDLATVEILWAMIMVGFELPQITDGSDPGATQALPDPPRPAGTAVLLHRLGVAATAATPGLPGLRDLAATTRAALEARWGAQHLPLAPAFRNPTLPPGPP